MPTPFDPAALPRNVIALRAFMLAREAEHAAEHEAARNGLKNQAIEIEQLKSRLTGLLRQQFGSSSEKMKGVIDQLELVIGDLEEDRAETTPPEPEADPSAAEPGTQAGRRQPKRKPLPDHLLRDVVEHPPGLYLPKMRRRVAASGRGCEGGAGLCAGVIPCHPARAPKMSCGRCESIVQPPVPSLPIHRGMAGPELLAHVLVAKYADQLPLYRQAEIYARNGLDLDRSTLADRVEQSVRLLRPLVEAIGVHVMSVGLP